MPHENASFRTHPLREIQTRLQGLTPPVIIYMYHKGMLENTVAAEVLRDGFILLPDHVTLAGLQITREASHELVNGAGLRSTGRFVFGELLDVVDGAYARHLKLSSPDGAVKDVQADRVAEMYIAQLIAESINKYKSEPTDPSELQTAFLLSTLTKAASEMFGVQTKEGGQGSMLQRRQILLFTLQKLGKLNNIPNINSLARSKLLKEVDTNMQLLIHNSKNGALNRIKKINEASSFIQHKWDNQALDDPNSSAAVEARKYAAVVRLSQKLGLDIVGNLNNLAGDEMFPSGEYLSERYGYVKECIENTTPFLDTVLSLVYPNMPPAI